jgi:hypothetical protein
VIRSSVRWAVSPDRVVHLLDHTLGGRTARCGALLPTDTHWYDQPPPGPPCEDCRVIYLADFAPPQRARPGGRAPNDGGRMTPTTT